MTSICVTNMIQRIIRRALPKMNLNMFLINMSISLAGAAPKANCLLAKPNMFRGIPIPFMFIARKLRKWDVEGSFRINQ